MRTKKYLRIAFIPIWCCFVVYGIAYTILLGPFFMPLFIGMAYGIEDMNVIIALYVGYIGSYYLAAWIVSKHEYMWEFN